MSLLSYVELVQLVEAGVIEGVNPEAINGASIDLHLGHEFMREEYSPTPKIVFLKDRTPTATDPVEVGNGDHYYLKPGEFVLAHTLEKFHLPDNISGQFLLKSSMARAGLDHALAGWADAWWNDSVLTLEFKNNTRYHTLALTPGMAIGQIVLHRHAPVPKDRGYAVRGRFNGDSTVTGPKVK